MSLGAFVLRRPSARGFSPCRQGQVDDLLVSRVTAIEGHRLDLHGPLRLPCGAFRLDVEARFCALDVMTVSRLLVEHGQDYAGCWHIFPQGTHCRDGIIGVDPCHKSVALWGATHKPCVRGRYL